MWTKFVYFVLLMKAISASNIPQDLVNGVSSFTLDLFDKVRHAQGNDQNLVISPFSVHAALSMMYLGSDGETASQMVQGLRLGSVQTSVARTFKDILDGVKVDQMKIANKIYVHETFQVKPEFNTVLSEYFDATAENVNFGNKVPTLNTINGWVQEKTDGKISNLLDSNMINLQTKTVLVNAMHFKAPWKFPFNVQATTKTMFWLNENDNKQVDMMTGKAMVKYGRFDGFTTVSLPYKKNKYFMVIALPNEKTGLEAMLQKIGTMSPTEVQNEMKHTKVKLQIPKFTSDFKADLKPILEQMGMSTMFTPEANFSKMTPANVLLSKVVTKASIDVNEFGTEATAATAAAAGLTGLGQPVTFTADHPFLYFIVDTDQLVYFMGQVVNP